jgi:glycosyltransferase involved in cell wall biosynthesis
MNLHVWVPDLFGGKGGIQVYSAFFLQALQQLYPKSNYEVFVKHDVQKSSEVSYLSNTRFHFAGSYPQKVRTPLFASQLITQGILKKPDLVITTHLNFAVAGYWLKRLNGTPYWAVAHGIDAWDIKNQALITALHHADKILCVSHFTRDKLLKQQNLDPDKVSILFNTFDSERFQISSKPAHLLTKYNLKPDTPIILTVARLAKQEAYKGYDSILNALPRIRESIPNIHYILVGKGNDQPRIEKLISQLGLQDCVTLAGFIPDEELPDYYNLCDVFAMASKKEGFGIVYLESLASGKPTIGGNQDGALDALCHGELGALVNPDDREAIAQTLIQVLQHSYPNSILYQPQLLRQKVIEQFGFEQFQKTLGSYLEHQL